MGVVVTVPVQISNEEIMNLFVSCFEGGFSPWLHSADLERSDYKPTSKVVWWGQEKVFAGDYRIRIVFDREQDSEGEGKGQKIITPASVRKGLIAMARQEPYAFSKVVQGEGDALTGDAFMQCVIFGKVIYG